MRQANKIFLLDFIEELREWRRHPFPIGIFLLLCLNVLIAPGVYAATGEDVTRKAAYAIALLGLVTLGLAIYLFAVILKPERF